MFIVKKVITVKTLADKMDGKLARSTVKQICEQMSKAPISVNRCIDRKDITKVSSKFLDAEEISSNYSQQCAIKRQKSLLNRWIFSLKSCKKYPTKNRNNSSLNQII